MTTPRPLLFLFAALSALAAAGCQSSPTGTTEDENVQLEPGFALLDAETDVTLEVEAGSFEPGGAVTLVLRNRSGEQVGYNLCFHALERRSGDTWSLEPTSRVCTAELRLLAPGEDDEYPTSLPDELEPGEYRVRIALYLMDREEQRDQVSRSFQVGD